MRRAAALAATMMLGLSSAALAAPPKPQRVMSLNLCTDDLILQLLPPERIASVTYLSRVPAQGPAAAKAAGVPVNYGTSEEVLAEQPDLVIAGTTSTPAVRALLKRTGIALLEIPAAENFDDIRAIARKVGRAVGEDEKADVLLHRMDATLAALKLSAPNPAIAVVAWDGGGNVPGPGTLFDAILTAAGAVNVAAKATQNTLYGNYTSFDLEQLVVLSPQLVVYGGSGLTRPDQVHQQIRHPVVQRLFEGRQITYNETFYRCGLPQSADAAKRLRDAMLGALAAAKKRP